MEGEDEIWRWIQCNQCTLRGQFSRPNPYIIGEPWKLKHKWTCTHCKATHNEEEMHRQLAFCDESTFRMDNDNDDNNDFAQQEHYVDKYEYKLKKGLHYAHININGIKAKFEDLKLLLNNEKGIIFLAVTETKLDSTRDHKNMFVVKIFHDIRIDREEKEGGGTILYVHHSCEFEVIDINFQCPELVECNIVKLMKIGMAPVYMCIIYIPPDRISTDFFEFYSKLSHFLTLLKGDIIILGDFNVNLKSSSREKNKLLGIATEYSFKQIVNFNTRTGIRRENGATIITETLLDHAYVKSDHKYEAGGFDFAGSDHKLIYVKRHKNVKLPPILIEYRNYKKIDLENFKEDIIKIDWDFLKNEKCKTVNAEFFEKQIIAIMDKHAPLRKMYTKGHSSPWYNAELGEMRKKRDRLKKEGKLVDYRTIRNLYNNKVRSTQNMHYKQQMEKVSNGEKVWDIFNEMTQFRHKRLANIKKLVTSDGTVISEFDDISNELASEFVFDNSESIDDEFLTEIQEYEYKYKNDNPEYLIPEITPPELQRAIGKVKNVRTYQILSLKGHLKFSQMHSAYLSVSYLILFLQHILYLTL